MMIGESDHIVVCVSNRDVYAVRASMHVSTRESEQLMVTEESFHTCNEWRE